MNESDLDIINNIFLKIINDILPENELTRFLNSGSKRIRALLTLNYIKALGKDPDEVIYKIITVCELIHNASLLHDDVIDNANYRRSGTSIGKKYSQNISILCGDYIISEAIKVMLEICNNRICEIFNKCVKNMALSEIRQYFMRNKIPGIEEYIEICKGKTASLFSAVLTSCAHYLDIDVDFASKFGELFGICFQLKNDLDEYSKFVDKQNKIYTASDILGIENALILSDNYKCELRETLLELPDNKYRANLEGMINEL